jgi:hypothetical protein
MKPDVSAKILVTGSLEGWFTGKKLGDYITLSNSDFKGARRIINGTDKASAIATIARAYDAALKVSGYGIEAPANRAAFDWWALFLKLIAFLKSFGDKK